MKCRRIAVALVGLIATGIAVAGAQSLGDTWRLGYDKSEVTCLPYRLYAINLDKALPVKGQLVAFKAQGLTPFFEDGTLFTKIVLAGPGDRVEAGPSGVTVNGEFLAYNDKAIDRLKSTAIWRQDSYVLAGDEYFVAGTEPGAFDSRYYGPVSHSQLIGSSHPIW